MDINEHESKYESITLQEWVMSKCDSWRSHYDDNYRDRFEEYYRLWRGIWAKQDSMRDSERSRIITPALQQAVESSIAEIEEATFGRGRWFDIRDDYQDQNKEDIEFTKNQLYEDMQFARARSTVSEVLTNSAVFGTGIGELYLEEIKEYVPAEQPAMDGQATAVGVMEKDRFLVKMRPVMPQNFLIDPLATTVEDALGCAVDMFVPMHQIQMDIDKGIYRNEPVHTVESDPDLEPDQELTYQSDDRVRLTRYYGLVPKDLFDEAYNPKDDEDTRNIIEALSVDNVEEDNDESYIEAIVVIANDETLLKVEKNPYMMQDRPIVAFQWDTVPSRFWGRGVCEKGYNSQKALDTELRARIDALALTVHPMMAVDASRIPRGAKYDIRPGKTLFTNGNPSEVLQPFNFGNVDQITFAQGQQLQEMVQQATGAVDSAGMQNAMSSQAKTGAVSMSLGAIIKRHKRTLLNFQDNFLMPFVRKAAHRYMQFNPDLYPAQDFKFITTGSLGIIAREYEVSQLVQLLQTMSPESPMYDALVQSVVEQMNLSNREELLAIMKQAKEPNPQEQQAAQQQQQLQQQAAIAQLRKLQAETQEITSRTQQNTVETQLLPIEEETRRISALARHAEPSEFEKLIEVAELELKEMKLEQERQDIESNERITQMQNSGQ